MYQNQYEMAARRACCGLRRGVGSLTADDVRRGSGGADALGGVSRAMGVGYILIHEFYCACEANLVTHVIKTAPLSACNP